MVGVDAGLGPGDSRGGAPVGSDVGDGGDLDVVALAVGRRVALVHDEPVTDDGPAQFLHENTCINPIFAASVK